MAREDLTPFERALYDDPHTSTKPEGVYDADCYICNDSDYQRMGLPLCRSCEECQKRGQPGHIAADDNVCSVCGHDEMDGEAYQRWAAEQQVVAGCGEWSPERSCRCYLPRGHSEAHRGRRNKYAYSSWAHEDA